jgi:hypothetical protein
MRSNDLQAVMAAWATRELSARLDVTETAKLLGFAEHDIQILMGSGKLTPLGDPAPNAPKWFAAMEIIRLAADLDWLNRATKEVAKYWRQKRARNNGSKECERTETGFGHRKGSPECSPNSSPELQPSRN